MIRIYIWLSVRRSLESTLGSRNLDVVAVRFRNLFVCESGDIS